MGNARTDIADTRGEACEDLIKDFEAINEHFLQFKSVTEEYIRSKEALKLDEARLEALLRLNEIRDASENEHINFSLEEAIRLTGSEVGWMGALGEDEKTLTMHYWSLSALENCRILNTPHAVHINFKDIWAAPITLRKPVIYNDLSGVEKKGFPGGHIPLRRFMGVPIYDGSRIVAVAEVGNKDTDYDRSDVRQLTLLMSGAWRIILRKRAEEAMLESRSRAELYVDLMGHDINNMAQVAEGFLELALDKLEMEGSLQQDDKQLLEKSMEALRNSAKLIDNVKKLQRIRSGMLTKSIVDLGRILDDAVQEFSGTRSRDISIRCEPISGCPVMAGDLLKDVFYNIVGNSIRHSSPEHPLMINIICEKKQLEDKDYYFVSIEDNGPGIRDERKQTVFERLERSNTLSSGLGLGFVKTLVDAYGGIVWAEDRVPGDYTQGCRIIVALPIPASG